MRTTRWRYIRYADLSEELYDLAVDPNEWRNLARDPQFAATKDELAKWLPPADAAPAPGSAHRTLVRDGEHWRWEGEIIRPTELQR